MAFTLGKFVRHVPVQALRNYFHHRRIEFGPAVDWTKGERALASALTPAVEQLSDTIREDVYADFERVDELADEVGERAILSAFPNRTLAIELFEDMQGAHERCLWLLLNHEDVFREAEEIRFSEYHRLTRTWDGFLGPNGQEIDQSEQPLEAFKAGLQRLFRRRDGSGRSIDLDIFRRWSDVGGDSEDQLIQITACLEGLPATGREFDRGSLHRRVRRPAYEMALTYDRETGAIDVVAKGGRRVRADIARLFLAMLLDVDEDSLESIAGPEYNLSRLLRPHPFPRDQEDGIASVEVVRLRLRPYSGGRWRISFEGSPGTGPSVYDQVQDWFGPQDPLRSGFVVERARLAMSFRRRPGAKRAKVLYVELTAHGSNLKDRTQHERLIGEKYLDRWELVKRG